MPGRVASWGIPRPGLGGRGWLAGGRPSEPHLIGSEEGLEPWFRCQAGDLPIHLHVSPHALGFGPPPSAQSPSPTGLCPGYRGETSCIDDPAVSTHLGTRWKFFLFLPGTSPANATRWLGQLESQPDLGNSLLLVETESCRFARDSLMSLPASQVILTFTTTLRLRCNHLPHLKYGHRAWTRVRCERHLGAKCKEALTTLKACTCQVYICITLTLNTSLNFTSQVAVLPQPSPNPGWRPKAWRN